MIEYSEMIGCGRTAEVYALGVEKILKLFHANISEQEAQAEQRNTAFALYAGLPVPEIYECVHIDGRQGLIQQRVTGISLLHMMLTDADKSQPYIKEMGRLHARMHLISGKGLPDEREQFLYMLGRQRDCGLITSGEAEGLFELSRRLNSGKSMLHMDYHPDNLYISGDKLWILDWNSTSCGDPIIDVGRTVCTFKFALMPPGVDPRMAEAFDSGRDRCLELYLEGYREIRAISDDEILIGMALAGVERLHMSEADDIGKHKENIARALERFCE